MTQKVARMIGLFGLVFGLVFAGKVTPVSAQNCGCDHVIDAKTEAVDASNLAKPVMPGQTICLMAGQKNFLNLSNFQGSATKYLILKNCGGQVKIVNSTRGYGIAINGSRFFRLTGTGDMAVPYGIKIDGTPQGASGLTLSGKSTDFEIDHIEITRTGFAGVLAKTDPSCTTPDMRSFVMKNVHFHHNLIYNTVGEGFYVGYFAYPTRIVQCSGKDTTLYPHRIEDVSIHHNTLRDNGWDGIQLGSAPTRASIHHNTVENYGTANETNQKSGIQLNAGAAADVYNNWIDKGTGIGIAVFGYGGNKVYNNVILRSGEDGIYLNDKTAQTTASYVLANNTIVEPGRNGIGLASANIKNNKVYNNLIVAPGEFPNTGQKSFIAFFSPTGNYQLMGNLYVEKVAMAGFVSPSMKDFHLLPNAGAINMGVDVSGFGITVDLDDQPRVADGKTDVGAYEYRVPSSQETMKEVDPKEAVTEPNTSQEEPLLPEESAVSEKVTPDESASPSEPSEKEKALEDASAPENTGTPENTSRETAQEAKLEATPTPEKGRESANPNAPGCACSSTSPKDLGGWALLCVFLCLGYRRGKKAQNTL